MLGMVEAHALGAQKELDAGIQRLGEANRGLINTFYATSPPTCR